METPSKGFSETLDRAYLSYWNSLRLQKAHAWELDSILRSSVRRWRPGTPPFRSLSKRMSTVLTCLSISLLLAQCGHNDAVQQDAGRDRRTPGSATALLPLPSILSAERASPPTIRVQLGSGIMSPRDVDWACRRRMRDNSDRFFCRQVLRRVNRRGRVGAGLFWHASPDLVFDRDRFDESILALTPMVEQCLAASFGARFAAQPLWEAVRIDWISGSSSPDIKSGNKDLTACLSTLPLRSPVGGQRALSVVVYFDSCPSDPPCHPRYPTGR